MRNYELVLILDPQLGENSFEGVISRYEEQLTSTGGEIVNIDRWGLRKLAYTSLSLKRRSQGFYVLYQFAGEPVQLDPLEQRLKVDEDVLRHLVTSVPGEFMRVPQLAPEAEVLGEPRRGGDRRPGGPGRDGPPGASRPASAAVADEEKAADESEPTPAPEGDTGTGEAEGQEKAAASAETAEATETAE